MKNLHRKIFFPLIILISVFIYFLFFYKPALLIVFAFTIIGMVLFFLSLRKGFIVILGIFGLISIIPLALYQKPPIAFGINDYHIVALLFVLIAYSIFALFINYKKYKDIIYNIPKQIFALIIIIIVYSFIGFIKGYETIKILREIINLSYYIIPFTFLSFYNIKKEHLFYTFEILIGIVFIEYILMYYYAISHLIVTRLVTRLIIVSLFAFPYSFLGLFRTDIRSKYIKMRHFFMLFIILLVSTIALLRSVWVTIIFDIIVGIFIYMFSKKFSIRSILSIIGVFALIVILFLSTIIIIEHNFSEKVVKIIEYRFFTISSTNKVTTDTALNVRFQDNKNVMERIKNSYLLGEGLGATIEQSDTGKTLEIVDNAYLVLLWKTGIIGFFVLMSLYFMSFHQLFIIYKKTKNLWDTLILALILINYLLNGFVNSCFVMYRYTIWIGLIMLIINKWYIEVINGKNSPSLIGSQ